MLLVIPEVKINEVINGIIDKFLLPKFHELGMNATGEWERSLEVRTGFNKGEILGKDYTEYLAKGRGPNKDQSPEALKAFAYYYGTTVIKKWADAKGININPIAIAYKIGRDGTNYYDQGGTDLLEILENKEVIDYISLTLGEFIIAETKLAFVRMAQQTFK